MQKDLYKTFCNILEEELITASGCTEPIALALASSKCIDVLGAFPEKITVNVSGNMIKNVKGVTIPGTSDLKGIEYSVILGAIVNNHLKGLDVLHDITESDIKFAKEVYNKKICVINRVKNDVKLYIEIIMEKGNETAEVEVMHTHTNITKVIKNGVNIFFNPCSLDDFNSSLTDRSKLNIKNILDFANDLDISDVYNVLTHQINCNYEIAKEGIKNDYGLSVGKTLMESGNCCVKEKMKAYTASGSDARMGGCDLPVVINSGSGNQGLTIANGIYIYCQKNKIDNDKMYRGLVVANLVAIHIKSKIGRLSAFCGVVSASIGVGAGISYIVDGSYNVISNTIKNGIGNLSGVICDGAKSSCAIKIASSVDASLLAHQLALKGKVIDDGIGIICECVEETIDNISIIASQAMVETDEMILNIMSKPRK